VIPLVAVAHGSRDPRSARAVAAALAALRARHPDLDVRLAFLDLNTPSVSQVLDAVAADGHRRAVVVPLLLGSAFHARVDLPALIAESRIRNAHLDVVVSDILGDDPLLVTACRDGIVSTGVPVDDPDVGVALCAVGSRRPGADAATRGVAPRVTAGTAWRRPAVCFATASQPSVTVALEELVRAGARRLVLAPWMLAPGLLWDRVCAAAESVADVVITPHLADDEAVGEVVLARYTTALERMGLLRAA